MPNILITTKCNLNCSYCFAHDYIKNNPNKNITLNELDKLLLFFKKINSHQIGILGGEPTLHPDFEKILIKILNFSKLDHQYLRLYTNGIELENYIYLLNDINILLNLNEPQILGTQKWNKIVNNIEKLNKKNLIVGINLYNNMKDYQYIINLAKEYKLQLLRFSYVAPNKKLYLNKEEYYENGKNLVLNFINEASKNNIKLQTDCNQIPLCYFTEQEQKLIQQTCINYGHMFCPPITTITPDCKLMTCFNISSNVIDINNFNNFDEMHRYIILKEIAPNVSKNYTGKCNNCELAKKFLCCGGCFGFINK